MSQREPIWPFSQLRAFLRHRSDQQDAAAMSHRLMILGLSLPAFLVAAFAVMQFNGGTYLLVLIFICWVLAPPVLETLLSRASHFVPGMLYRGGKVVRDFSAEDAMISRGEPDRARHSFQKMLLANPGDYEVRVRLATLIEDEFKDLHGALPHWELLSRPDPKVPEEVRVLAFHRRLDIFELKAPDTLAAKAVHAEILKQFPDGNLARRSSESIYRFHLDSRAARKPKPEDESA